MPYKRYYDILTWLTTQLAFSFTVSPFILLSAHASLTVWVRVYLYTIVGVACCFGFLNSPGKSYLVKELKKRNAGGQLKRMHSAEKPPTLGLPDDPEKELQEIIDEVKAEMEARRAAGMPADMSEVKKVVNEKVQELRKQR